MKIKLPEKRYFSISELAKRWECENSDVAHLLEIGELPVAEKLAAIHGKRSVFFGYYGYQINPERPCYLPKESEEKVKYWNETARDDQAILVVPVACDFPVEGDCHFKVYMQFEKLLAERKQEVPEDFEPVILLQDVLKFEANCIQDDIEERHTSGTYVAQRLATLNKASRRFWANADRDDRSTHPTNNDVVEWLVQHGYTQTLAEKAATIVRPEWAPTGRKPEE